MGDRRLEAPGGEAPETDRSLPTHSESRTLSDCFTLTDFEDYDAGRMSEEAAGRFRQHLDACDTCRIAFDRFSADQEFLDGAQAAMRGATMSTKDSITQTSSPKGKAKASSRTPNIDGYRITGVIGQGGMGIVYRAVQTKLNRTVALKVLPAMVGAASPAAVSRFRREAMAAARLHHTNIVPIYDFGESPDAYYYAMELIVGQPLNLVIKSFAKKNAAHASAARLTELLMDITASTTQSSTPSLHSGGLIDGSGTTADVSVITRARHYYRQVAAWMADAADALHYAHTQNIIHRDVKPANLIISTDGRIMIADFGLAKSVGDESVTQTGSLLGTVRYLSPEQAMARRMPVDARTDIYSLGATMYELLCFQPAFPGTDEKQVLSAIITRDPTAPRKISTTVPAELETICLKSLEKDAHVRYPTARAMAEDLRRYTHDLPIEAKRPGPVTRTIKFAKRHKGASIAAVLCVLLLATIVVAVSESTRRRLTAQQLVLTEKLRREARINENVQGGISTYGNVEEGEGRWTKAADFFDTALGEDPGHLTALYEYARMKKEQFVATPNPDPNLLLEGKEYIARALDLAGPLDLTPDPDLSPRANRELIDERKFNQLNRLNLKGVFHKKLREFAPAVTMYEEALDINPYDPYLVENLAVVTALNGDLALAEEKLLFAAELTGNEPRRYIIWCDLASIQRVQGSPEAKTSIEKAIAEKQDDTWSALIRARIRLAPEGNRDPAGALDDAVFARRSTSSVPVSL